MSLRSEIAPERVRCLLQRSSADPVSICAIRLGRRTTNLLLAAGLLEVHDICDLTLPELRDAGLAGEARTELARALVEQHWQPAWLDQRQSSCRPRPLSDGSG